MHIAEIKAVLIFAFDTAKLVCKSIINHIEIERAFSHQYKNGFHKIFTALLQMYALALLCY